MTRPTKTEAMRRLQVALEKIPSLKKSKRESPEFGKWRRNTRIAIEKIFGEESNHVKEFTKIGYYPTISGPILITDSTPDDKTRNHEFHEYYVNALGRAATLLDSMIEEVEEYWEDETQESAPDIKSTNGRMNEKEIFVIHGSRARSLKID